MKQKVFVSFDWENDRRYKFMLEAWDANPYFDFTFYDASSDEIDSENIDRIKAGLTTRIREATHTLVIVGKYANSRHRDAAKIGSTNWINFEVKQSKAAGSKLVGVKLDRSYTSPDELLNAGASWAMAFDKDPIVRALREA